MFFMTIADGYTLDGKVSAHKGTAPVVYKYRPALPEQVADFWYKHSNAASGKEQFEHTVNFIAAHAVSWDAKTGDGKGGEMNPPMNAEWLKKVPYPILQEIRQEILSFGTGDPAQQAAEQSAKN